MTDPCPLIVDLDGTLCRTDTLWESLLQLGAAHPWRLFGVARAYWRHGRAGCKRHVARQWLIDPGGLIFNHDILALIQSARDEGRDIWLVSGADQAIVDRIATYFGFFGGAQGSDGTVNLTRMYKTDFLTRQFGAKNYDYAGDSRADLPVWAGARRGYIVAQAGRRLTAQAQAVQPDMHVVGQKIPTIARARQWVRALRIHQWAKNILILTPALAGHRFDIATLMHACIGVMAFSLTASSVYILNDILDLPHDRQHRRKRNRPFAAGLIKLGAAPAAIMLLLLGGFALGALLPWRFGAILAFYYACTMGYSLKLKRLAVWDIITLAGLYTLRVFAGAAAIRLGISPWLLAFSLFLFFCLAVVKRLTELTHHQQAGHDGKISGRGYLPADLDMLRSMAASCGYMSVLVLILYTNSAEVMPLYRHPHALWGLCPILMTWVSRVLMLAQRGDMHDDPVVFALRDQVSLLLGAIAAVVIAAAMWQS